MKNRGFSLLEMVIVLTILAGMAAIVWPVLSGPLEKMRLKAAAQEVTNSLSRVRMMSMQEGVSLVFRVQKGTGKFQIAENREVDEEIFEDKELSGGVCFDVKDKPEVQTEDDENVAEWTDAAVFFPNGDATNCCIELYADDLAVDLKLSGFTNSVKIGDAHKTERCTPDHESN